jgi:hypothetical protein
VIVSIAASIITTKGSNIDRDARTRNTRTGITVVAIPVSVTATTEMTTVLVPSFETTLTAKRGVSTVPGLSDVRLAKEFGIHAAAIGIKRKVRAVAIKQLLVFSARGDEAIRRRVRRVQVVGLVLSEDGGSPEDTGDEKQLKLDLHR